MDGCLTAWIVLLGASLLWMAPRGPEHRYRWDTPPVVVIAPTAPRDIDDTVMRVVERWRARGHCLTVYEPIRRALPTTGVIAVDLRSSRQHEDALGQTWWVSAPDGEMLSALITIRPDLRIDQLEMVLDHEFGHALGFTHARRNGHVMSPSIGRWGPIETGLEAKCR
jgi:hypothetical protein